MEYSQSIWSKFTQVDDCRAQLQRHCTRDMNRKRNKNIPDLVKNDSVPDCPIGIHAMKDYPRISLDVFEDVSLEIRKIPSFEFYTCHTLIADDSYCGLLIVMSVELDRKSHDT